jgi:hypothetical protein
VSFVYVATFLCGCELSLVTLGIIGDVRDLRYSIWRGGAI